MSQLVKRVLRRGMGISSLQKLVLALILGSINLPRTQPHSEGRGAHADEQRARESVSESTGQDQSLLVKSRLETLTRERESLQQRVERRSLESVRVYSRE
jgi:hypothetical protein